MTDEQVYLVVVYNTAEGARIVGAFTEEAKAQKFKDDNIEQLQDLGYLLWDGIVVEAVPLDPTTLDVSKWEEDPDVNS
jgi:hypothetical protein